MNKFHSFLTQNLDQMQAVEPDEQRKIDGGCAPTSGPGGILGGDIGPVVKLGQIQSLYRRPVPLGNGRGD